MEYGPVLRPKSRGRIILEKETKFWIKKVQTLQEQEIFVDCLREAHQFLLSKQMPLWTLEMLQTKLLFHEGVTGYLGYIGGEAAATMLLCDSDIEFWGEESEEDSAVYLHKFSVRRKFASTGIPAKMIDAACEIVRQMGREYLRLDCRINRPALTGMYDRLGFERVMVRDFGYKVSAFYQKRV